MVSNVFKPKGEVGWIEVLNTDLGKWTSLPNPPSQINSNHMISALAKKEIIVTNPSTSRSSFTGSILQSPKCWGLCPKIQFIGMS